MPEQYSIFSKINFGSYKEYPGIWKLNDQDKFTIRVKLMYWHFMRRTLFNFTHSATHDHYKSNSRHWCFAATRRKVISNYWLGHVLTHFGALYGFAILLALSANQNFHYSFLIPVILVSFLSFCVLFITHYWLFYYCDFLPKLDTVVAMHEHETKKEEKLEKCCRSPLTVIRRYMVISPD